MTCNACGEKPKNTAKDFTKAVIEINNPETLVLLRKVVIPASMGTEEQVPPAIGKYHNVILYYEANKHVYLYSSDGIPTAITSNVPQEVLDDITELEGDVVSLQNQIDDLKNSPDVVDVVATKADLDNYDTSTLTDNDIIRVLADETHDDASAYYRWDKTNSQWVFIGITGPYYTKSEIDTTVQGIERDIEGIQSEIGQAKVLSSEDYNWNSQTRTAVEPFDCIALWLLDSGVYSIPRGVTAYTHINSGNLQQFVNGLVIISSDETTYTDQDVVSMISLHYSDTYPGHAEGQTFTPYMYSINKTTGDGRHVELLNTSSVRNNLVSTGTVVPLAAYQGKVLNERIGDLSTLQTTANTSVVAAINEVVSGGGGSIATINSTDWSALWQ